MMITRKAVIPSCRRLVVRRTKSTAQPITNNSNKQATVANTTAATTTTKAATTTTSSSAAADAVPVGASLLAAAAGVALVSSVASIVESSTSSSCLPYKHNGQRFDQSTFEGRFARMMLACDPKLLLTNDEDIRNAQELLLQNDGVSHSTVSITDRDLWEARRVVDAALHPDTGDVIPKPFRMSGYVPFNGPICVAMVASTSTMPLLFWSWVNQSQNALVNYYVSFVFRLWFGLVPTCVCVFFFESCF